MPRKCNSSTAHRGRLGLHGDFWTRFLLLLLRWLPPYFCVAVAWPISSVFFLLATEQRRSVRANLRVLKSNWSSVAVHLASYRVFVEFALTYMDRIWALHLGRKVRWEAEDYSCLSQELASGAGVLLFTTHSGNFDVATTCLSQHFPRPMHIVRLPEQTQSLHGFREQELKRLESAHPGLKVHYAKDAWDLGIELFNLLKAGEVVAVQGDRSPGTTQAIRLEHNGVSFQVPKGPLVLAQIARVPCYPVFIRRLGWCRYCIKAGPPFYDGREARRAEDIGQAWLSAMADFVGTHWEQWFVFERTVRAGQVTA